MLSPTWPRLGKSCARTPGSLLGKEASLNKRAPSVLQAIIQHFTAMSVAAHPPAHTHKRKEEHVTDSDIARLGMRAARRTHILAHSRAAQRPSARLRARAR